MEYFKVKNFDDKIGTSSYQCFRLNKSDQKSSFNPVSKEEISKVLKPTSLRGLIESLTKKVKSPLEVSFLLDGDTLFLIGLKEVILPHKKFIEFVVSSVQENIIEKEDGLLLINPEYLDIFLHPSVSEDINQKSHFWGFQQAQGLLLGG